MHSRSLIRVFVVRMKKLISLSNQNANDLQSDTIQLSHRGQRSFIGLWLCLAGENCPIPIHLSCYVRKPTIGYSLSEGSDQPAHLLSLIRIFTGRILDGQGYKVSSCAQRRLSLIRIFSGYILDSQRCKISS